MREHVVAQGTVPKKEEKKFIVKTKRGTWATPISYPLKIHPKSLYS